MITIQTHKKTIEFYNRSMLSIDSSNFQSKNVIKKATRQCFSKQKRTVCGRGCRILNSLRYNLNYQHAANSCSSKYTRMGQSNQLEYGKYFLVNFYSSLLHSIAFSFFVPVRWKDVKSQQLNSLNKLILKCFSVYSSIKSRNAYLNIQIFENHKMFSRKQDNVINVFNTFKSI